MCKAFWHNCGVSWISAPYTFFITPPPFITSVMMWVDSYMVLVVKYKWTPLGLELICPSYLSLQFFYRI